MNEPLVELECGACSWRALLGPEGIERQLRAAGMLRRDRPDPETLHELLHGTAAAMACPECRERGLRVRPVIDLSEDDGDWQDAVTCEICRKPIPPERLEAQPGAKRCIACQQDAESGKLAEEPEYCPKCGSPMTLRMTRGAGITRYKLFCTGTPACR